MKYLSKLYHLIFAFSIIFYFTHCTDTDIDDNSQTASQSESCLDAQSVDELSFSTSVPDLLGKKYVPVLTSAVFHKGEYYGIFSDIFYPSSSKSFGKISSNGEIILFQELNGIGRIAASDSHLIFQDDATLYRLEADVVEEMNISTEEKIDVDNNGNIITIAGDLYLAGTSTPISFDPNNPNVSVHPAIDFVGFTADDRIVFSPANSLELFIWHINDVINDASNAVPEIINIKAMQDDLSSRTAINIYDNILRMGGNTRLVDDKRSIVSITYDLGHTGSLPQPKVLYTEEFTGVLNNLFTLSEYGLWSSNLDGQAAYLSFENNEVYDISNTNCSMSGSGYSIVDTDGCLLVFNQNDDLDASLQATLCL